MHLFDEAKKQLLAAMSDAEGRLLPGARVVQLGDLGGYKHKPGRSLRDWALCRRAWHAPCKPCGRTHCSKLVCRLCACCWLSMG